MRDGRLAGAELASFARHTTVCGACRREVEALERLAAALRPSMPAGAGADELHVMRERTRLIAAFDETVVASTQARSGAWRMLLWPTGAAAVIAAAVVLLSARPAPLPVAVASVVVHADGDAVWARRAEPGHDTIVLDRGELWIHVDHTHGQSRLVVALPDGELEDTGTTFTVRAEGSRTTRIAVEDGSVALRLHGKPAVAIGRGQTWVPERQPAPAAPARAAVTEPDAPGRPSLSQPSSAPPRRAPSARAASTAEAADPARDFRAAVAMLDAGANHDAALAFARFLDEHPQDARAEDAAYLRVLALHRSGADAQTKRAAQEYLRHHPAGFRRAEIERLSR